MKRRFSLCSLGWGFFLATFILATACIQKQSEDDGEEAVIGTVSSFDGVPIQYAVQGTGSPALVFVHGWVCDRSYWAEQVAPFSRRFRVITVDLAGHGESGTGRNAWTIESFGEDVAAVVQALELEEAVLIGHSMGGDGIVEAARGLPGRVAGLVWVDTYRQLGPARTPAQIQEFLAPFRAEFAETTRKLVVGMFAPGADKSLVQQVATDMAAAPPDIGVAALESSFNYGRMITTTLDDLNVPIIAINPEDPAANVESLRRHGIEVILIPEVGHFVMMEAPEKFNSTLAAVIQQFSD